MMWLLVSPRKIFEMSSIDNNKKKTLCKIKNRNEYILELEKLSGETPFVVEGKQYQITSRNTYNVEHTYAANYIAEYLRGVGLDEVFFQSFTYASQRTQNIIGVKVVHLQKHFIPPFFFFPFLLRLKTFLKFLKREEQQDQMRLSSSEHTWTQLAQTEIMPQELLTTEVVLMVTFEKEKERKKKENKIKREEKK